MIVPAALLAIVGGVAIMGINKAEAFSTNPFSDIAQLISQKFGLDQKKVQEVVTQYESEKRVARQTEMKAKEETRLSSLVSEEKITEAQKRAIIAKQEELRSKYQPNGMQGKTAEERSQIMEARKAEIESWAKTQGINLDVTSLGMGSDMGRGMGAGRGDGMGRGR